jgi:hypothetical protein
MSLIDKPKKLIKYLNDKLIPRENEKKQFGEVFTPLKLVKEMLNKLDETYEKENGTSIFTKPELKWLDPANGLGNFVVILYYKLMNGLKAKISEPEERKKHILENMIYVSELNKSNMYLYKMIVDPNERYKLNINEGDSLKLDIEEKWEIEKFDIVIGNPPYNKGLYKNFTEKYITKCDYMTFVIPSTFTIGVSHVKFIDYLKENNLRIVRYLNRELWNNLIDIDTLYFVKTKKSYEKIMLNDCCVDRSEKIYNVKNKIHYEIIKKLDKYEKLELLKGKNKTLNYKNKVETDEIKFTKTKEHKYY